MSTIKVDVQSNIREVVANFGRKADAIRDKATVRALNRALDATATQANRKVRERYNVRAAAVARAMEKKRAFGAQAALAATLVFRGRRMNLLDFGARQTKVGVSVKVKVDGPRKVLPGTFIATNTHSGFTGVFRRVGKSRYPIKNLRSVSIPQMVRTEVVMKALKAVATEAFVRNFKQQVQFLGKGG